MKKIEPLMKIEVSEARHNFFWIFTEIGEEVEAYLVTGEELEEEIARLVGETVGLKEEELCN